MRKTEDELRVIDQAQALLVWTSQHAAKFPRAHRHSIGLRLENRVSGVRDELLRAKYTTDRAAVLREINLQLEQLRFDFRVACELHCLSLDSGGSAARFINEIGKLVGAWLKRAATKSPSSPA